MQQMQARPAQAVQDIQSLGQAKVSEMAGEVALLRQDKAALQEVVSFCTCTRKTLSIIGMRKREDVTLLTHIVQFSSMLM